jgi:hypothetical protein
MKVAGQLLPRAESAGLDVASKLTVIIGAGSCWLFLLLGWAGLWVERLMSGVATLLN